jgi:hypothetical protein
MVKRLFSASPVGRLGLGQGRRDIRVNTDRGRHNPQSPPGALRNLAASAATFIQAEEREYFESEHSLGIVAGTRAPAISVETGPLGTGGDSHASFPFPGATKGGT